MDLTKKFQRLLKCSCDQHVTFETINDVECDWGLHTLIQCPKCEELFSANVRCPAFQDIQKLFDSNPSLYTEDEKLEYVKNSHGIE